MNGTIALLFTWLLLWLVVIVGGCVLFTNAVEWLGRRLNLGQGAVGSVLAAVGTALPETLVGLVAILWVGKGAGHEIGVGAILGAPLLLSTLAMPITGIAVLAYSRRRPQGAAVVVDRRVLGRDLRWFYLLFAIVLMVSFAARWPSGEQYWLLRNGAFPLRVLAALLIVPGYVYYVRLHIKEGEDEGHDLEPLYFARRALVPSPLLVVGQCCLALAVIILGARCFAGQVQVTAAALQVSPQILALIIAPIATELPEKMNSVLWVRQGKDTLALGNISGAMVFQGSVPVMAGMLLTEWRLDHAAMAAMLCAFGATLVLTLNMRIFRRLPAAALIACGGFYVVWLVATFFSG